MPWFQERVFWHDTWFMVGIVDCLERDLLHGLG
jgi:hypothetical protein